MSTLAVDDLAGKHRGNDPGHRSHHRLDAFWTPFPSVIGEDFLEPQDLMGNDSDVASAVTMTTSD